VIASERSATREVFVRLKTNGTPAGMPVYGHIHKSGIKQPLIKYFYFLANNC
jgi:hypothetical protein